jgi:hypothetical protein
MVSKHAPERNRVFDRIAFDFIDPPEALGDASGGWLEEGLRDGCRYDTSPKQRAAFWNSMCAVNALCELESPTKNELVWLQQFIVENLDAFIEDIAAGDDKEVSICGEIREIASVAKSWGDSLRGEDAIRPSICALRIGEFMQRILFACLQPNAERDWMAQAAKMKGARSMSLVAAKHHREWQAAFDEYCRANPRIAATRTKLWICREISKHVRKNSKGRPFNAETIARNTTDTRTH